MLFMILLLLVPTRVPKNFVCMYVLCAHFCLCVCALASMWVLVYVHLCMHVCVETEMHIWCLSYTAFHIIFWDRVSSWSGAPCFSLVSAGITDVCQHGLFSFFCGTRHSVTESHPFPIPVYFKSMLHQKVTLNLYKQLLILYCLGGNGTEKSVYMHYR